MSKKLVTVALAVLLVSFVSIGTPAGEKVTIKYWYTPFSVDVDPQMVEEFMKIHPNVQVELEAIPSRAMAEKVMLSIAANDTPNVLYDYIGRLATWNNQNALESLNGTLSEKDLQDIYPSMLTLFTKEDDLFGYPMVYWIVSYVVNNTLLERAGIEMPKDFTLDKWEEIAEKLSNPPELYATCFFANGRSGDYWMLVNFQIFGAALYTNGDYTKTTLNSEAGVRALEWMIGAVKKGFAPEGVAALSDGDYLKMFTSGKSVMQAMTPDYSVQRIKQKFVDQGAIDYTPDWKVIETPHVKGIASPPLFVGPSGVIVFKEDDEDKREAAIELAKFLSNPENTLIKAKKGYFPARKSADYFTAEDQGLKFALRLIAENGAADMGLASPHYLEVRNALYPELQAAFMETKTAKQALDDFAKAVEEMWEK